MGFRFRKSVRIAPGVRLNFSKKGLSSLSVGRPGATVNMNADGAKTTLGLPGTGLSYSTKRTAARSGAELDAPGAGVSERAPRKPGLVVWLILGVVAFFLLRLLLHI